MEPAYVTESTPKGEAPRRCSPHPGLFDRRIAGLLHRAVGSLVRTMWPAHIEGFEQIPRHDDVLFVANHSGMGGAELASLMVAWLDGRGDGRPVAGMAHPSAFYFPHIAPLLRGMGAVEATYAGAAFARSHGRRLLLFPGGDAEAMRPVWRADDVDFFGRKGWIRIAREHRLSIVPLAISGSHLTHPMLASGRAVAWLSGARLFGVRRAPLPLSSSVIAAAVYRGLRRRGVSLAPSVIAGLASMYLTVHLPWIPSNIRFQFLPAIDPAEHGSDDDALYRRVVGALGEAVRAGSSGRRSVGS